jgi:hypothetical protein
MLQGRIQCCTTTVSCNCNAVRLMQFHVDSQPSSSTRGTMVTSCALTCQQQCMNNYGLFYDSVLLLCFPVLKPLISTPDVLAQLQRECHKCLLAAYNGPKHQTGEFVGVQRAPWLQFAKSHCNSNKQFYMVSLTLIRAHSSVSFAVSAA